MSNPAPTLNQINAFNATQGTTIDFNIIGGTELVRSNRIYIYDLSDNSLICTHLYVSTESIHELPANTDSSIVYESGKSSANFVNGAQYYAQIQTYTDTAGTQGGSGLSVAKMFWCLVDPTLTITTIPSTISTTSYNVSATYNANTSVVSNIIQQYQFNLYSATGSLLQSSGVVVGSGTQQGTSTAYDISYNFTGLSVGSSYYVVVDVTTTQGMSVTTQSNTFMVSIDTPTLGEATVVNNACDGYISVTSNLSSEYGGSGSGEIVSFETDSENVFTKLQVDLEPVQDLNGYDAPWVGGAGKNKLDPTLVSVFTATTYGLTTTWNATKGCVTFNGTYTGTASSAEFRCLNVPNAVRSLDVGGFSSSNNFNKFRWQAGEDVLVIGIQNMVNGSTYNFDVYPIIYSGTEPTSWTPYENICPITGNDEVDVSVYGKNLVDFPEEVEVQSTANINTYYSPIFAQLDGKYKENTQYTFSCVVNTTDTTRAWGLAVTYTDNTTAYLWLHQQAINYPSVTTANGKTVRKIEFGYNSGFDLGFSNAMLELGTIATTYEPYQGQSYHQDIEATYTPTVQENEAYLFKQTGDVGGDRETIELVGGTVAWNQQIHSDFSEGVDGWRGESGSYMSCSASGGVLIATYQGGATAAYQMGVRPSPTTVPFIAGHKLYITTEINVSRSSIIGLREPTAFGNNSNVRILNSSDAINTWHKVDKVVNVIGSDVGYAYFLIEGSTSSYEIGDTFKFKNHMIFDLTQMFGSTIADYIYSLEQATAGAGVAFFRNLFPKAYYPYNAGELISVKTSAHKTVGKNQFHSTSTISKGDNTSANGWTWNGNTATKAGVSFTLHTDANDNITEVVVNGKSTASTNIYFTLFIGNSTGDYNGKILNGCPSGGSNATYGLLLTNLVTRAVYDFGNGVTIDNDNTGRVRVQIVVSPNYQINNVVFKPMLRFPSATDSNYEPYVENTYPLDPNLELHGMLKLDISNKLYYDGDTYKYNGSVNRKYGIVDMGTIIWQENNITVDGNPAKLYRAPLSNSALVYNSVACICSKYPTVLSSARKEKTMSVGTSDGSVDVIDSTYDNAVNFRNAMNGVYLVYELNTPTTETADPFEEIQICSPYGTEEFVDNRAVPMPVGNNTQYFTRDVYGGYIDLVSGVLVVSHGVVDGGTLSWLYWYGNNFYAVINGKTANSIGDVKCEIYETTTGGTGQDNDGIFNQLAENQKSNVYIKDSTLSADATGAARLKALLNGHKIWYRLAEPLTFQLTPQQIQTLVGVNNVWSEQGDIELSYHIPITNLLVKRQDVADVSGDWLTLYSQPITQASDMDFTFIDFTNQYGKTYKYALVPLLTQTQSGVEVEVEGGYTVSDEVQSVFDGVFIVDSTGSQKCKANVGYGNVDMNQSVGTITPIGAKYPVVITNSKNQYHNGSISGTIVPDDYYFNGNLSRIDMVNKRDELEQFLTNKRAKIIKDWNGKIWLVMIMDNVSCTFNNNYGMGIVNFNTNWVEVGDPTNQQDLQATGLINVGGV